MDWPATKIVKNSARFRQKVIILDFDHNVPVVLDTALFTLVLKLPGLLATAFTKIGVNLGLVMRFTF